MLERSPTNVSKLTEKELKNLNVHIKFEERVATASKLGNDQHELTLTSGRKLTADVYIPTFGLAPNNSYIPAKFLNAEGFVVVDEYLQVKGAKDVWAIGDISATEGSQYLPANTQATHAVKNIILAGNGKALLAYKGWVSSGYSPIFLVW